MKIFIVTAIMFISLPLFAQNIYDVKCEIEDKIMELRARQGWMCVHGHDETYEIYVRGALYAYEDCLRMIEGED